MSDKNLKEIFDIGFSVSDKLHEMNGRIDKLEEGMEHLKKVHDKNLRYIWKLIHILAINMDGVPKDAVDKAEQRIKELFEEATK